MDVAPPHDRYLRVSKFDGGMESYTLKSNRQLHYSCSCGVRNPEKIIPAVKAAWGQDPLSRKTEKWSKPEKYGVRVTTLGYRRYESVRFYVPHGDISSSMVSLSLDGEGRKFYVFQLTWNLVCNKSLLNPVIQGILHVKNWTDIWFWFPNLFSHQIIWSGWALFFYVVRGWGTKASSGETALISYSVWQQRHCNHIKQRPLTIAIKVYCVLKKRLYSINYPFTTRLSISTIIKMFKIPTDDNFLVVSHLYLGRRGMSAKQGE